MNRLEILKTVALPKTVKVAIFVGVSAGLTYLLNNLGNFKWDASLQLVVTLIINSLIAGLKDYIEATK